jgi:IS4 transposase
MAVSTANSVESTETLPAPRVSLPALFAPFVAHSPLAVMARALLERTLLPDALDHLFLEHASSQINHELLFSSVVDLLSQVALRINLSVRQAYLNNPHHQSVSLSALYQKINHLEPSLGPALVRYSAYHMQQLIATTGGLLPPWRPGYRLKILDGNHLSGTQHRLKVLRRTAAAALPGHVLAVLDPRQHLFLDLIPCEDAYTQERALLEQVLPQVEACDVWVADRNFCTPKFLTGIDKRRGLFAIREHTQLNIRYLKELAEVGRCSTGLVFEHPAEVTDDQTGEVVLVRRTLVKLDEPTRDGEMELAVLTNLPADVAASVEVAELYLKRWTIEVAFAELTVVLRCEIETLGYPRAALFSFAVAALAANLLAAMRAVLGSEQGSFTAAAELSVFQEATDIAGTYRGMMIAIPAKEWRFWTTMNLREFVAALRYLATKVDWEHLQKAHPSPRKPLQKKPSASQQRHVSTQRLLIQEKEASKLPKAN